MTKEDITTFAPISIPTLCRYEHFKRCIESLSRCTWAEYTDVYVALDYPAKESHWEGYRKIKTYLEKCGNLTFKSLNVVVRDRNYGFGPNGNHATLTKEIEKKYDRRILSEDDNEFSPNFLVYMNKAFEMFKNDERIMCVSGYNHRALQNISSDSVYCSIDTPAYGLGFWCDKREKYDKWTYENLLTEIKRRPIFSLKLAYSYPSIINMAITMIKEKVNYNDLLYATYNMYHNTFCLCPTVSLSRNWGCDGSGLHSGIIEGVEKNEISSEKDFTISKIDFKLPVNYSHCLNRIYGKKITIGKSIMVQLRVLKLLFCY